MIGAGNDGNPYSWRYVMIRVFKFSILAFLSIFVSFALIGTVGAGNNELKILYNQLINFKDDPEFHRVGFGFCCKYKKWQTKVETLRNGTNLSLNEQVAAGDLLMLGSEYKKTKGLENNYTQYAKKSITSVLGSAPSFNAEVFQAQKALKALGYNPGPLDGLLGKSTNRAVKQFQSNIGLPTTGQLDDQTKKGLATRTDKLTAKKNIKKLQLIGEWKGEGIYNWTSTVQRKNGKLIMIMKQHGSIIGRYDLIESRRSGQTRYDEIGNERGEYYLINHSGDLEIYDTMGLITTQHRVP